MKKTLTGIILLIGIIALSGCIAASIRTDKGEYEIGETVKLDFAGANEFYHSGPVEIKKLVDGAWQDIHESCFCTIECSESKKCEYYSIYCEIEAPKCSKLEKGTVFEWNQAQCITRTIECTGLKGKEGEKQCAIHIPAEAGKYKFILKYWANDKCEGDFVEAESNEFTSREAEE
jgi:hypothetical protein